MAYTGPKAGNSGNGSSTQSYPIARMFALAILVALGLLIALRQVFGSIRVEVSA